MYTEGVRIGNNTYILSEEDGSLKMAIGSDNKEEMEEYIKLENMYEDKLEERNNLQEKRTHLYELDKNSRKANIEIAISTVILEGIFILLGGANQGLSTAISLLSTPVLVMTGIAVIFKPLMYSTKRKRTKKKNIINNEIEDVNKELEKIKEKIDTIKEKMEYSEFDLREDEIVPVTTEENKKSNVKMRVLKIETK